MPTPDELLESMKQCIIDSYKYSDLGREIGRKNAARKLAIVFSKTPLCPPNWLKIAASILNTLP